MTPLAMRLLKAMIAGGDRQWAQMLGSAPTFEMSEVVDLVAATAAELISTVAEPGSAKPLIEHGGLLLPPANFSWFEARIPGGRIGILANEVEDQICFFGFEESDSGEVREAPQGFLELQPDGEHFSVHLDLRWPQQRQQDRNVSTRFGLWLAASLLLINAPRGVEAIKAPAHKGMAKKAKASGLGSLADTHTIRLSLTSGHVGELATDGHGPKAFHFCRSHWRRLPSGLATRVRAHWRGDPAVGVHSPTYRVAA